ncbi:hypothetical protein CK203_039915 [Vitis vinifera]|uniref:Uncharacterized protein n=1 Tax=Vitis vinifera TaxID=29760 RepID=A0A438I333_VITVI|nr:hypothetical protein CK203_039915 [Vitis vinifera]
MEHLLNPRDFFYPRVAMDFYQSMTTNQVRDPTLIHFTIDGRHGILGAHHIAEALHIPYEPARLEDYREEAAASGYYSTSFPEIAMPNFGAFGYPSDPQLERRRICREVFTLDKWTNMTAYRAEHPELPQPQQSEDPQLAEIPATKRASTEPIHEGIPSAFPTTHSTPPVIPTASEPSTLAEPRMTIPLSEYRDLCHTLQTLTVTQSSLAQEMSAIRSQQEQILTTQTQHTAILRQLQHHLGLPSATEHLTPTTTEPHAPPELTTEDVETSA